MNCGSSGPTQTMCIQQGDDYAGVITVLNLDGTPSDLTGYTARGQLRLDVADEEEDVAVELTCNIQDNRILLSIPKESTMLLAGPYVWDVELVSSEGMVTTIAGGNAFAIQEVSRYAVAI